MALAGWLLVGIGVVWLARAVPILWGRHSCASWPSTTGTVLRRDTRVRGTGEEAVALPVVRYRYWVEGVEYESERIGVVEEGFRTSEAAQRVVEQYVSNTVPVRYDPRHPERAVLCVALPSYMPTVLLIGAGLVLTGVGIILFG